MNAVAVIQDGGCVPKVDKRITPAEGHARKGSRMKKENCKGLSILNNEIEKK